MNALLAAILAFQSTPAQSAADKFETALKKFGDRSYLVLLEGKRAGVMTLKTRVEKAGGRRVVVFEDRITLSDQGRESTAEMTEKATMDGLRLISTTTLIKDGDRKEVRTLAVESGKAKVKVEGREQTMEVTDSTIGERAMFRIVCAAEQKEGSSIKADVLGLTADLQTGHTFRCLGMVQVDLGGKKLNAFKWENRGEWKNTKEAGDQGGPDFTLVDNAFWVSPDGYLLRYTGLGGIDVVLDAK